MPAGLEEAVDGYVAAWNETDAASRAVLLADSVSEDFEFHGPTGTFRGRAAVDGLIVALQIRLGGAVVARVGPVVEGTFRWAVTTEAGATLLAGTDEVEAGPDGRLTRIAVAASPPSA